jgi:hypothetical protein
MGTRHLIAVVLKGEYKVAQYGQWDGYPTGQGIIICDFIQNEMKLTKFKKALKECKFISSKEIQRRYVSVGADPKSEWVNMDISDKFAAKWPHLVRECGGDILSYIQDGGVRELQDSIDFAADSLFCEWAYVLDLDNKVLEVYKGFNKAPLPKKDRFKSMEKNKGDKYYPVRLYAKYPFKEATRDAMDKLDKRCKKNCR